MRKKARVIVVLSDETLRFSDDGTRQLLDIELSNAMATATNNAALPKPLDALTLTASSGSARTDLATALAAVPLSQASRPFVFTSPDVVEQLAMLSDGADGPPTFPDITLPNGGSISGMPLLGIDACSDHGSDGDLLVVVDAVQFVGFLGPSEIDVATQGDVQMIDNVSGSGPTTMTSLFQSDAVALSMKRYFQLEKARTELRCRDKAGELQRRIAVMQTRAWSTLTLKAVSEELRVLEGVATTPSTDRLGDVVEPTGVEFDYRCRCSVDMTPSSRSGTSHAPGRRATGSRFRRSSQDASPAAIARSPRPSLAIDQVGPGARPIDRGRTRSSTQISDGSGATSSKWSWLELSTVTIPANAQASIATIKSLDSHLPELVAADAEGLRLARKALSEP